MFGKKTEVLTLNDFKTRLCHYLHLLQTGEHDDYMIRRYRKNVAIVMSVRAVELNAKANASKEKIREHFATLERFREERRVIDARLLSWPGVKYFGRCRGK